MPGQSDPTVYDLRPQCQPDYDRWSARLCWKALACGLLGLLPPLSFFCGPAALVLGLTRLANEDRLGYRVVALIAVGFGLDVTIHAAGLLVLFVRMVLRG